MFLLSMPHNDSDVNPVKSSDVSHVSERTHSSGEGKAELRRPCDCGLVKRQLKPPKQPSTWPLELSFTVTPPKRIPEITATMGLPGYFHNTKSSVADFGLRYQLALMNPLQ
ncbi:MAG: hypothetical protein FJ012_02050 [Chloroflexi bacterium]|nr:hypothetical protein [Chloroflexota bacterium]